MMDNILYVVPYTKEHGRYILSNQMNHPLMDKDAEFDGDAMNLEEKGLAYTCMINNEPVAAAGMKIIWSGVAEGWVISNQQSLGSSYPCCTSHQKKFCKTSKRK